VVVALGAAAGEVYIQRSAVARRSGRAHGHGNCIAHAGKLGWSCQRLGVEGSDLF
jgi:hypothetical protein